VRLPFDVNDAAVREAFLCHQLLAALEALTEASAARWGRMTAQQMVEHLLWAFECSTGRVTVECPIPVGERPRLRQFLYHNRPTPREFMNPALTAGLPRLRFADLDAARWALGAELGRFVDHVNDADEALYMHPIFGPLGVEDWARTHYKHGHHHLLQFGLLEAEEERR
jgi:oxepin-CoA hydrolase / 3-oxo-5,6-dehydrosuberyl-CoA semialdehyde dehydrogenase